MAGILAPHRSFEELLHSGAETVALEKEGEEQEVTLEAPPLETVPTPTPEETGPAPAPALVAADPVPLAEPPPPPEPDPDFAAPAPPAPAPAAEPVAAAQPVEPPTAPAVPADAEETPRVVIGNQGFPKPPYPYAAKARRTEGTVVLALDVVDGAVVAAAVVASSGSAVLDQAALRCVRTRWRFPSATTCSLTQPIRFALDES